MEMVDENEGYYDEEVINFMDGEELPTFSMKPAELSEKIVRSLYVNTQTVEETPAPNSVV